MQITIELTTWLKKYTEGKSVVMIDLENDATVAECLFSVGIPIDEVGFIMRNGQRIDQDKRLEHGDIIKIFTSIIGG